MAAVRRRRRPDGRRAQRFRVLLPPAAVPLQHAMGVAMRLTLLLLLASPLLAAAQHLNRQCASAHGAGSTACVAPGTCTPPDAQHSAIAIGPKPGLQWDLSGGFCGAFSTQQVSTTPYPPHNLISGDVSERVRLQSALAAGAWISQDLVRMANIDQPGPHAMHGNNHPLNCSTDPLGCGWEVMPSNVKYTADHLKLASDEFDYTQPSRI